MPQRDVVLRWIEQAGRVIARLLGTGKDADLDLARDELARAAERLLGPVAVLVPRLEAESAIELVRDPDRLYGYARLLALESACASAAGDAAAARDANERARAFAAAALARADSPPAEWREWVTAL